MPYIIRTWADISENYTDTILLGNGASIAVDDRFNYRSLYEQAALGDLQAHIQRIFNGFETENFEYVLRLLWQATHVNNALNIEENRTEEAYQHVRRSLIQTVNTVHPEYGEIEHHLPNIYNFLRNFRTVLSLNYDLIVYWTMMYGLNQEEHIFKDCFNRQRFNGEWARYREQLDHKPVTLVFYPHGNLILSTDVGEQELKLSTRTQEDLLQEITTSWDQGRVVPLFVSEGTREQKVKAINRSFYLSTVYREVMSQSKTDLTILGWSFGEQDLHLLERMQNQEIRRVAVSVFRQNQQYCEDVSRVIRIKLGPAVHVDFFDVESPGCWNRAL